MLNGKTRFSPGWRRYLFSVTSQLAKSRRFLSYLQINEENFFGVGGRFWKWNFLKPLITNAE